MGLLTYPGTESAKQREIFWRMTDKARVAGLVGLVSDAAEKNTSKPVHITRKIDHLPEVLFVRVQLSDGAKTASGRLKIEQDLTIPIKMQYPKPKQQDGKYQLCSIIFTYDKNAVVAANDEHNVCAVMEPTGRWARVNDECVPTDLTLANLLTTIKSNRRPSLLAYRRLPLNGLPSKPPAKMGVLMHQEIDLNSSSGVEWKFDRHLELPDVDQLIKLEGKKKTHCAQIEVRIVSDETGEVYEGKASITLTKKRKLDGAAAGDRDGKGKRAGRGGP
ncbi:hypothetical protein BDW75DRAFT_212807 [Aspergillus navahoensis]